MKRTKKGISSEGLGDLRTLYLLKRVERMNHVGKRHENTAEHTWSALMLADCVLSMRSKSAKTKLDRLKILELLMYHDLVEIEVGDVPIHHEKKRINKEKEEWAAAIRLKKRIPAEIRERYISLFREYEDQMTPESRFAKGIDRLDAQVHELDEKKDWKGWDEGMLRKYVGKYTAEFPEIDAVFETLLKYTRRNGYFGQ